MIRSELQTSFKSYKRIIQFVFVVQIAAKTGRAIKILCDDTSPVVKSLMRCESLRR